MITRRSLLGACLAGFAAPAIVRAEVLMPVRKIIVPERYIYWASDQITMTDPMLYEDTPLRPGMYGYTDDYREFQRLKTLMFRNILDNAGLANNPPIRVGEYRWAQLPRAYPKNNRLTS